MEIELNSSNPQIYTDIYNFLLTKCVIQNSSAKVQLSLARFFQLSAIKRILSQVPFLLLLLLLSDTDDYYKNVRALFEARGLSVTMGAYATERALLGI